MPQYLFERLTEEHDRDGFVCEKRQLSRFLRERALRDMRSRLSVTHVLVEAGSPVIAGYYTLAATSIPFSRIPEAERKRARLSLYPLLSATLIARLARAGERAGQGIGSLLLVDALRRSYQQTGQVGAAFVIVDALDEEAARFYQTYGFLPFPDESRQLFLAMRTLENLAAFSLVR